MTITLAPPVSAPVDRDQEERRQNRQGCHLTADSMTTLCGLSCSAGFMYLPISAGPLPKLDPCCCGNRRCPRCKEIWEG